MNTKKANIPEILIISKEPTIERIPGLKTLISHLAEQSYVTIITSRSKAFAVPAFGSQRIKLVMVNERKHSLGIPVSIKITLITAVNLFLRLLSRKKYVLIYAGKGALIMSNIMRIFGARKYVAFIVEYPELIKKQKSFLSPHSMEIEAIKKSIFYITQDNLHGKFINEEILKKDHQYKTLPNSEGEDIFTRKNTYFHENFDLQPDAKILLHSGGFGPWFLSAEVSAISSSLSNDFRLVFHASHDVRYSNYYKDYIKSKKRDDTSMLSLDPQPLDNLHLLVSSAYIGIAWYNLSLLGYRAELMGLASGKIGSYLRCGIPVVAQNISSLSYLGDYECGILVEDIQDIPDAVDSISKRYDFYRSNAFNCYKEIWNPGRHLAEIDRTLALLAKAG